MSDFLIDISALNSGKSVAVPVDREVVVDGNECRAIVRVLGSVGGKDKDSYRFIGRLEGVLERQCARCLAGVSLPYEAELDFEFEASEKMETVPGGAVDFESAVSGAVRADMPISVLCAEDCKGLCQVCGCDLNMSECGCEIGLINPVIDKCDFSWD